MIFGVERGVPNDPLFYIFPNSDSKTHLDQENKNKNMICCTSITLLFTVKKVFETTQNSNSNLASTQREKVLIFRNTKTDTSS